MALTTVANVNDVPAGQGVEVAVGGKTIALFNLDGKFYALDNTCTHAGGPLSEGECAGSEVTCPWHGARFDLTTGAALSGPARQGVTAYKVQLNGDNIQIEV